MATRSKKEQVQVTDIKPQKDAKGGKKLSSKTSKNLFGGGGSASLFGPHTTSKGPAVHEN